MPIVNRQEFSGRVLTRRLPLLRVDAYSVPDLRAGFAASHAAAACPYRDEPFVHPVAGTETGEDTQ